MSLTFDLPFLSSPFPESRGERPPCTLLRWFSAFVLGAALCACDGGAPAQRTVVFLNPAGNPPAGGRDPFEKAFEQRARPFQADVRLEFVDVPAEDVEVTAKALAALKSRRIDALVTIHTTIAEAIVREMPGKPLVFLTMADPVLLGVVDDAVAPRTDVTGFTSNVPYELKHVELLKEVAPGIRRIGIVSDHFWAMGEVPQRVLAESPALFDVSAQLFEAETPEAVATLAQRGAAERIDAWFIPDTPINRIHAAQIAAQVLATGKPSIGGSAGHVRAGGLIAYEALRPDPWPRLADMTNLILSGVPARTIPFDRPKTFRVVVNRARAAALGLELPRSVLLRADEFVD
jgi:putative ABC transport system substrate-binding protein